MNSWLETSVAIRWLRRSAQAVMALYRRSAPTSVTIRSIERLGRVLKWHSLSSIGILLASAVGTRVLAGWLLGQRDNPLMIAVLVLLGCLGGLLTTPMMRAAVDSSRIVRWVSGCFRRQSRRAGTRRAGTWA